MQGSFPIMRAPSSKHQVRALTASESQRQFLIGPTLRSLNDCLHFSNVSDIKPAMAEINQSFKQKIKQIACHVSESGRILANEIIEEERNEKITTDDLCACVHAYVCIETKSGISQVSPPLLSFKSGCLPSPNFINSSTLAGL